VATGLILVNLIKPGQGAILPLPEKDIAVTVPNTVSELITRLVPDSVFKAMADMDMLGLIFFSLVFGLALNFVPASTRDRVLPVVDAILAMMMKITHAIIMLAPLGVFALVTRLIAETEPGVLKPLLPYALTVALGLVVHFFLTLPLTMERAEKGVGVSNRVASFVLPIGAMEKELESVRLGE
jgi:Na+/H+-dicarboxylate symporter